MNNERRSRLRSALTTLNSVHSVVSAVCDKEEDCLDNYPENLQGTERYDRTEAAVDSLNDALEKLDEVTECIQNAISQ